MTRPDLNAAPLDLVERKAVLQAALDLYNCGCISNVACVEVAEKVKDLPSHPVQADAIAVAERFRAECRRQANVSDFHAVFHAGRHSAADEILAILKSTRGAL